MQMGRSNVVNLVFVRVIVDELDARDFYGVILNGTVAVANKCCSAGSDLPLFVLEFLDGLECCNVDKLEVVSLITKTVYIFFEV